MYIIKGIFNALIITANDWSKATEDIPHAYTSFHVFQLIITVCIIISLKILESLKFCITSYHIALVGCTFWWHNVRVSNENRVMLLFAVSVDFHTEWPSMWSNQLLIYHWIAFYVWYPFSFNTSKYPRSGYVTKMSQVDWASYTNL